MYSFEEIKEFIKDNLTHRDMRDVSDVCEFYVGENYLEIIDWVVNNPDQVMTCLQQVDYGKRKSDAQKED